MAIISERKTRSNGLFYKKDTVQYSYYLAFSGLFVKLLRVYVTEGLLLTYHFPRRGLLVLINSDAWHVCQSRALEITEKLSLNIRTFCMYIVWCEIKKNICENQRTILQDSRGARGVTKNATDYGFDSDFKKIIL